MSTYDAIVIGTGGVGSAALFHLAQRGLRVLGLDLFPPGHDRGSSHGQTRIIRQAYFEHPDYVPLLRRAYELWAELEDRCQEKLYHETGLIEIGPPAGMVLPGVMASARQHGLAIEQLSAIDVHQRFSGFVVPSHFAAVFERHAGYLLVERCVLAHLKEAEKLGAELRSGDPVIGWQTAGQGVTVRTRSRQYAAARLVVTAGAWSHPLLQDLGIRLQVVLKHLHWYANNDARYRQENGCPTFFFETSEGYYYGFPQFDQRGVKVAEHSGGDRVGDPLRVSREVDPVERRRVEKFLGQFLPGVTRKPIGHTTCFYTLSPDEHFIVDRHPSQDQVVFAAGLSGHGFKFTGVLGEVLADLSLEGNTSQPIGFLGCQRRALHR